MSYLPEKKRRLLVAGQGVSSGYSIWQEGYSGRVLPSFWCCAAIQGWSGESITDCERCGKTFFLEGQWIFIPVDMFREEHFKARISEWTGVPVDRLEILVDNKAFVR